MTIRLITLTTDFGLQDNYVASLHGVIHSINPKAVISDITHQIPSFDIEHGSYVMGTSYSLFPKGTIHVGVVDPGVGSQRLPLLICTRNYYFIGPDNGLLAFAAQKDGIKKIYYLNNSQYFLKKVSFTFHGRDIFSPVAAHLSKGISPGKIGKRVQDLNQLNLFDKQISKNKIQSCVIAIDKFGNGILNISRQDFKRVVGAKPFALRVRQKRITCLSQTYSEGSKGNPVLLFGSNDYLELAFFQGNLAKKWGLKRGDPVTLMV